MSNAQCDACITSWEDYVEKQWRSSTVKSELFLLEMKIHNRKYALLTCVLTDPGKIRLTSWGGGGPLLF